jgi:hypothetical protein
MQSCSVCRRFAFALYLVTVLSWPLFAADKVDNTLAEPVPEEREIDVVWSTSDGRKMEIYYSCKSKGVWSEPEQVTDDHYDNMYPVVDRDSSGRRWVFWSAYDNGRMELRYAISTEDGWERSEDLASELKKNLAPSVVIDSQDRVWVVWSANDGGFDDIMFAYYQNGSWSEPVRLHAENDIPDVLPTVELDPEGNPVINWQMLAGGKYITVTSRWTGSEWSEAELLGEEVLEDKVETEENVLELPSFMSNSGSVFIRAY